MTGPAGSDPGFLARSIHGREEALAALSDALDRASAGVALALVGEAGMGKSRLARWAAERAGSDRRVIVEGRAVLGLTDALGVLCDGVRAARRAGLTPRGDPVAARFAATILPELGAGGLEPEGLGATFEGAALYLRALAGGRGLLLILEDLHWADPTSLRLVPFLARALTPARTTMLLTYRPDDGAAAPALEDMRQELRRTRLAEEVALEALTAAEAAGMLAEILGRRPPAGIEAELVRLAGGNPFALEELTRAAADSGWLHRPEGHGPGEPLVLPFTLTESIRARAGRLDEEARELLRWAAVVGERFDARLLGAVADLSEDETLSRLERCIAAGLVAEDPADASGYGFAFRHALVREALSQEGLAARRRLRHSRVLEVGEALAAEGVPISAAELAGHALAAGDPGRTITHSKEAARRALQLGAVEETVAHLEQALALWPEDGSRTERAELLRETGRLRSRGSRGDEEALAPLEEALAEFQTLGDDASAAWTLALLATAHFEAGRRDEALDEWERAVGSLRAEPGPPLRSALTAYARGLTLNNRLGAAAEVADEGLALVPSAATAAEALDRVSLLATRGMVAIFQDDLGGRALVEEALQLATAFHDDVGAARAHHILGEAWYEDVAAGVHHLATAAELVGRHGLTDPEAFYAALSGYALAEAGDWKAAERRIADAQGSALKSD